MSRVEKRAKVAVVVLALVIATFILWAAGNIPQRHEEYTADSIYESKHDAAFSKTDAPSSDTGCEFFFWGGGGGG